MLERLVIHTCAMPIGVVANREGHQHGPLC